MSVFQFRLSTYMDVRKVKTSILAFILLSAVFLIFFGYLGANVGSDPVKFWIVLGEAAFLAFFLGYKTSPLGDFFVSQPKEIGNDQTSR